MAVEQIDRESLQKQSYFCLIFLFMTREGEVEKEERGRRRRR